MQQVLLISCDDLPGLIYKVTGILYGLNLNIIANWEFVNPDDQQFFMRIEFAGEVDKQQLLANLTSELPKNASISLPDTRKKNIVIMATKESHCLGDLLVRCLDGDMNANLQAVISNYNTLEPLVNKFEHPFHYVDHKDKSREDHEQEVTALLKQYTPDYIVLAKYMRILTPAFVAEHHNQIINIHHSFLPAFIGASPYHQAHDRGVKIIGATAHFVNNNLDEGPIISQDVTNVDHTHSPNDMAHAGRDVEKIVLAKALRLVLEDRVFVSGNKTIIFE